MSAGGNARLLPVIVPLLADGVNGTKLTITLPLTLAAPTKMCDSAAFADRFVKLIVPLIMFSASSNTKVPKPLAPVPDGGFSFAGLSVAVKLKIVADALAQTIDVKATTDNNLRTPLAGFFISETDLGLNRHFLNHGPTRGAIPDSPG